MRCRPLLAVTLAVAAVLVGGAVPVPSAVHVQPGAAPADGSVTWTPPVQVVTGDAGEVVAVDLALDDGTEHPVTAGLAVRSVAVDPETGPSPDAPSDVVVLAVSDVHLRPGDRAAFRGTAVVPADPTLVAIEARLQGDGAPAAPFALVLVGPPRPAELDVDLTLGAGRAEVTVANRSPYPAVVDLAVSSASWLGGRSAAQVHDVVVAGDGRRVIELDLPRGFGRRTVEAAVAPRGGGPGTEARVTARAWPPRAGWVGVAAVLVLLAGGSTVRVLRRS